MTVQLSKLIQAASSAANKGRWQDAERYWSQVRDLQPDHPQALYSLGVHALQKGDSLGALEMLQSAHRAAPSDPMILLTLSMVMRERGDTEGEWEAISAALAIEPYFLAGLLAKAGFIERSGRRRYAADLYRNALKVAPPEPYWPEMLRPQLVHAQAVVKRHLEEFAEHLDKRLGASRVALDEFALGRWDESAAIMAGKSKPYHADCNQLCVPRLPAIPFFDRRDFAWVEALEAKTGVICGELHDALQTQQAEFTPYVTYAAGDPVNQWQELNHSRCWSTYKLWSYGTPIVEHQESCPQTTLALAEVEMAKIDGLCPNAMFSVLAPRTKIPPHHGETNARLVVHLPLVVPEGCSYRVGFERRQWRVGEVLIFDDSIEHEARNDSDEPRAVLIFDVWNPLLSRAEREMVSAMMIASREFMRED